MLAVRELNSLIGLKAVKTEIERIIKGLGLLSKGHLVEVDRSSLCADYVDQTATKTEKVILSAPGEVLFIDEAYPLPARISSGTQDYGREAVSTLFKEMEDHREDLIVIVASYTDLMEDFISMNPGLEF